MCVFYRHCFIKSREVNCKQLTPVGKGWLDKSDEAFCIKSATKSTAEAASHSVLTAFRLPNLHIK